MSRTEKAAKKYVGDTAKQYDGKRSHKKMWQREEAVLRDFLIGRFDTQGAYLLDVPVGTFRFAPLWKEIGFNVTGVDVSPDMLELAEKKRAELDFACTLEEGSIFRLPYSDNAFDISVAIRIITLIEEVDMVRALRELQRVTKREIIFNTRVPVKGEKVRKNAQSLGIVEGCLQPGWWIAKNVEIHEPSFRMIRLYNGQ